MIPIVIPTMPQRTQALRATLRQLSWHLWALPVISRHVDSRQGVGRALRRATEVDSHSLWIIYLEDDIVLSPRFSEVPRILVDAAADMSIGAICFFRSKDDLDEGVTRMAASKMSMSQCTAIRTLDPEQFEQFATDWYARHPQHHHASDLLLGAWVSHLGQDMLVHSPSLVQHRRLRSTLGPRARNRQSESFRRAFGEVA